MGQYLGFVAMEGSIPVPALTKDTNGQPAPPVVAPTYRVYGPAGLMNNGTGSLAPMNTGNITAASNVNPIVITSNGHGLTSGTRLTVSGVLGNTAANGSFTITVIDVNTFSIPVAGNGAYTGGGTWTVSGLFSVNLPVNAANGYTSGETYVVLVSATVGANAWGDLFTFTAV